MKELTNRIIHFFNLESELEDQDSVYIEIKKAVLFKGTNLWILILAILIASVGLNMNSTAVIIGAMLISPLMGPINGIGYSIATYDYELFRQAVKNFTFAIIASLSASTIYFTISPVSTAYSELLARTSPTIYDVLIALFGGLAGIIAISSKNKGNVIPGVAIATALMPPLCTAGYGLATWQFSFFFGALYLFTINTIFIAIASVIVSQFLNFPIRKTISEMRKKKINRSITIVLTFVLLPSIFFGYKLVKEEEFKQNAIRFISNISSFEGNFLLKHEINPKTKSIELVYGGTILTEKNKKAIERKLEDFKLENSNLKIEQGLSFGNSNEVNIEIIKLNEQNFILNETLKKQIAFNDSIKSKNNLGNQLLNELSILFPHINGCYYSESINFSLNGVPNDTASVVVLTSKINVTEKEKKQILNWLTKRLNNSKIHVYYERNL